MLEFLAAATTLTPIANAAPVQPAFVLEGAVTQKALGTVSLLKGEACHKYTVVAHDAAGATLAQTQATADAHGACVFSMKVPATAAPSLILAIQSGALDDTLALKDAQKATLVPPGTQVDQFKNAPFYKAPSLYVKGEQIVIKLTGQTSYSVPVTVDLAPSAQQIK